jgi:hypothetical protein
MASENFKLTVLNVLAASAEGRATLAELRRDVPIILADKIETEQLKRFRALGDIDIFQSGLLLRNDTGFEITEAGFALLQSLESPSAAPVLVASNSTSPALKLIDDLIGTKDRLKIFDLELRTDADDLGEVVQHPSEQHQDRLYEGVEAAQPASEMFPTERIASPITAEQKHKNETLENLDPVIITNSAPSLEIPPSSRRGFGDKPREPSKNASSSLRLFAGKLRSIPKLWRRHVARDELSLKAERVREKRAGAAFAFLTALALVACVGAAIAFGEIKSLKSDIALLQRELLPLKERIGKFEQAERIRRESEQQEAQNKLERDKREAQPALNLSREDIQLVREVIKPAPFSGMTGPTLNVGDPVGNETIPLPSSITDKLPKLLGARFTIRNGSIIIVKRGGQQADAVLGPN